MKSNQLGVEISECAFPPCEGFRHSALKLLSDTKRFDSLRQINCGLPTELTSDILTWLLALSFGRETELPKTREANKLAQRAAELFTFTAVVSEFWLVKGGQREQAESPTSILVEEENVVMLDLLEGRTLPNLALLFEQVPHLKSPAIAQGFKQIIDALLGIEPETLLSFFYSDAKWATILAANSGLLPVGKALTRLLNLPGDESADHFSRFLGHRMAVYGSLWTALESGQLEASVPLSRMFFELQRDSERIADGSYLVEQILYPPRRAKALFSLALQLQSSPHLDLFAAIAEKVLEARKPPKVMPLDSTLAIEVPRRLPPASEDSPTELFSESAQSDIPSGEKTGVAFTSLKCMSRDEELRLDSPHTPDGELKGLDNQITAETSNDQILNFDLEVYDPAQQRASEFMEAIAQETEKLKGIIQLAPTRLRFVDSSGLQKTPGSFFLISAVQTLSVLAKGSSSLVNELIRGKDLGKILRLFPVHSTNNSLHLALFNLLEPLLVAACAAIDRPSVEESLDDFAQNLLEIVRDILGSKNKTKFLFNGFIDKICVILCEELKEMEQFFDSDSWKEVKLIWHTPRLAEAEDHHFDQMISINSVIESVLPESFKLDDSRIKAILLHNDDDDDEEKEEHDENTHEELAGKFTTKDASPEEGLFQEDALIDDDLSENIIKNFKEALKQMVPLSPKDL